MGFTGLEVPQAGLHKGPESGIMGRLTGGISGYHEASARDACRRIVGFLNEHLKA